MKKTVIALDIGGVCVSLCQAKLLRLLNLPLTYQPGTELLQVMAKLERGQIGSADFLAIVLPLVGADIAPEQAEEIWGSFIGPTMPGMSAVVAAMVKRDYELVFFSNTSCLHLKYVERNCDFWSMVSGGVYSFETGFMKPEAGMYEAFEKAYGIPALYVDDTLVNIESAQQRHWPTHHFKSAAGLLAELPVLLP